MRWGFERVSGQGDTIRTCDLPDSASLHSPRSAWRDLRLPSPWKRACSFALRATEDKLLFFGDLKDLMAGRHDRPDSLCSLPCDGICESGNHLDSLRSAGSSTSTHRSMLPKLRHVKANRVTGPIHVLSCCLRPARRGRERSPRSFAKVDLRLPR